MFAGRLKFFLNNWTKITSNATVLSWIKGYRIPFASSPPRQILFKSRSERDLSSLSIAINELCALGAITECCPSPVQFLSPIFLADKANSGKRFILNLKHLNKFIISPHFKMEDLRTAARLLHRNAYMTTIDLKNAYFLVPVAEEHRKFLRFEFKNQLFEFTCLPFGLCSAPFCFTKLLKPIIAFLRTKNIALINYLDDFLVFGNSYDDCLSNTNEVTNCLTSLGFVINKEKSSLIPSTLCQFLGFLLDSKKLEIQLPLTKKEFLLKLISSFLQKSVCKIRDFACLIGTLVSACPAVKYGFLYLKGLEREKFLALNRNNMAFNALMLIPSHLKTDLLWWLNSIPTAFNDIRKDAFDLVIFTDASLTGWGACCGDDRTHGFWSEPEANLHINKLELLAIFNGLQCYARNLRNSSILIRCDNTTALAYVNRMGSIQFPDLCALAKKIWQWCENKNLWIHASYISSKDNAVADRESRRLRPETEWSLSDTAFVRLTDAFGIPEIDLFASCINAKCKKYFSWHRDPGSLAVDAFNVNWSRFFFYAFPPFSLILRTIQKIIQDKAEGIIVVPFWPAQPWFPLFRQLIVGDEVFFRPANNLLTSPFCRIHPLAQSLTLVGARLSGKLFFSEEYHRKP